MVPKDLTGFSIAEINGFAKAVRLQIAELQAAKADGTLTAEQVAAFEALAEDHVRLHDLIQAAAEEAEAEEAVSEAVAGDDPTETPEGEDDDDGEGEGEGAPDPETVVDDAVAAAKMGGGDVARTTRDVSDDSRSHLKKFVSRLGQGNVRHEEKHSFSTMRRETNHIVRQGADATEAIARAIADRKAGTDKTAAACFCGPDDALTAIKECGDTIRPLSDSLPTLTVSGDVRYIRQIDLADALTGVTEWTCADQDLVDPEVIATWKPCFELECEAEVTSALYAVSACASFNTQQFIGNPALVANLEHVMQVAFSKTAELLIYNRLRTLSSQYSFGYDLTGYGAGAQLLAAVGWAMELVAASLREQNPGYTLAIPAGLKERILTDGFLVGAHAPDETWAIIVQRLNQLGVTNVVELVDEIVCTPGPPAAHAVPTGPTAACVRVPAPAHPVEQEILLYRPEDFLLGVGPDIDLGITRSPELARQNKLQWFTEGFEFLEKVGCAPAIDLVVPFCASGIRPALGTGEDCTVLA